MGAELQCGGAAQAAYCRLAHGPFRSPLARSTDNRAGGGCCQQQGVACPGSWSQSPHSPAADALERCAGEPRLATELAAVLGSTNAHSSKMPGERLGRLQTLCTGADSVVGLRCDRSGKRPMLPLPPPARPGSVTSRQPTHRRFRAHPLSRRAARIAAGTDRWLGRDPGQRHCPQHCAANGGSGADARKATRLPIPNHQDPLRRPGEAQAAPHQRLADRSKSGRVIGTLQRLSRPNGSIMSQSVPMPNKVPTETIGPSGYSSWLRSACWLRSLYKRRRQPPARFSSA